MAATVVPAGVAYSEEERLGAIDILFSTGSCAAASKKTHIPPNTIYNWSTQDWAAERLEKLRNHTIARLDARFQTIVELSAEAVVDRLESGDYVTFKDTVFRKPVSARDAALIGAMYFDKLRLHRNQPTAISSVGDAKLRQLEDKLQRLGANARVVNDPPDVPRGTVPSRLSTGLDTGPNDSYDED